MLDTCAESAPLRYGLAKESESRGETMSARARLGFLLAALGVAAWLLTGGLASRSHSADDLGIGREVAVPRHLQDGEEFGLPLADLLDHGAPFLG
jgi:hypothetical protein